MDIASFIGSHGSQAKAAEVLGLSQGFLSKLKRGAKYLSVQNALRIEREHGIDAWRLVSPNVSDALRNITTAPAADPSPETEVAA